MNIKLPRNNLFGRARIIAMLLAGIFLVPALRAQPSEKTGPTRFLFIFDTSLAMKTRLEATQKAVTTMLASSLNGQLHSGDSIGVWTFNQDLSAGNFPLQTWDADDAVTIAGNLTKFVGAQRYAKTARFESLQPLLNQVVQGSERLTVLIFCDGSVKAAGTPFDADINQTFQQKLGEQNKARQPFIILLRSQLGKFTGCAISFPPAPLNIPEFPPLPTPPPAAPKVTNLPPPVAANPVPSLFITGTNVSTNPPTEINPPTVSLPLPQAPAIAPTNPPIQPTNPPSAPQTNPVIKITPPAPTNAPIVPTENSSAGVNNFLIAGAGLGTAAILGIILRLRWRRRDTSLITRSMNDHR